MVDKKDTLEAYRHTRLVTGQQAKEEEQSKSANQRAADIAYTINHTIICTLSDFIDPIIGNYTQKLLNARLTMGHDHGGHGHTLWQWAAGEFFGDLVAVPITITAQRTLPGQMRWINGAMESTFGTFFKDGARGAALDWAMRNNISTGDERVMAKAKEYYDNEVQHLAQTAVWTAGAYAANVLSQKFMFGNPGALSEIIIGKGVGSMVTAGMVVGARSNYPEASENYDALMSKYVVTPATNIVNGILGVSAKDVENAAARAGHEHSHSLSTGLPKPETDAVVTPEAPATHREKAAAQPPLPRIQATQAETQPIAEMPVARQA